MSLHESLPYEKKLLRARSERDFVIAACAGTDFEYMIFVISQMHGSMEFLDDYVDLAY